MWEEWERHERKSVKRKKKKMERERARAALHSEALSESRRGEREMCSVCAPDESERDKEINCQEEPVNPERQRREHVCI